MIFSMNSSLDQIPQDTKKSVKKSIMMKRLLNVREKISVESQLFFCKDLSEVVQTKTWCLRAKKNVLIWLLSLEQLRSIRLRVTIQMNISSLKTIKKEFLTEPLKPFKAQSLAKLWTIFPKNWSVLSKKDALQLWSDLRKMIVDNAKPKNQAADRLSKNFVSVKMNFTKSCFQSIKDQLTATFKLSFARTLTTLPPNKHQKKLNLR